MKYEGRTGATSAASVIPNYASARSAPSRLNPKCPREMSSSSVLTSTFKSDIFLLQMRQEKLYKKFSNKGSKSSSPTKKAMMVGEQEIQKVLGESFDIDHILTKNGYENSQEAIKQMNIKLGLMELLEKKKSDVERYVVKATNKSDTVEKSSVSSLSRLPSFLSLVERTVELHESLYSERLKASSPVHSSKEQAVVFPAIVSSSREQKALVDPASDGDDGVLQQQQQLRKELESTKKLRQVEKKKLTQDISTLKSKCKSLKESNESLKAAMVSHTGSTKQTAKALQEKDAKLASLALEIKRLKGDLSLQRDQHQEYQNSQTAAIEAKDKVIQNLKIESTNLNNQVESATKAYESHESSYKTVVSDLKATVEQLQSKFDEAQEDLTSLRQNEIQSNALRDLVGRFIATCDITSGQHSDIIQQIEEFSQNESERLSQLPATGKAMVELLASQVKALREHSVEADEKIKSLLQQREESSKENSKLKVQVSTVTESLDHMQLAMDNMESVSNERLEPIEAARLQTEIKLMNTEKLLVTAESKINEMKNEAIIQNRNIVQLQQEKKDLIKVNVTDDTFADTYEEVMKEEFMAMKGALTRKATLAEERIDAIEKEHGKRISDLMKERKNDRIVYELKLRHMTTENVVLKEKLAGMAK